MHKKQTLRKYISYFLLFISFYLIVSLSSKPIVPNPLYKWLLIPTLIIVLQAQIIIHELGHLVMGYLTGYRFLSFRYLSWIIIKDKAGKYHINRYYIPGTLGQCLMVPPKKEKTPIFWYNFGGVFFNLITMIGGFVLFSRTNHDVVVFITQQVIVVNYLIAYINWFYMNGTPNDGNNYRELKTNDTNRVVFYDMLNMNARNTYGERISMIPLKSKPEHLSYEIYSQRAMLIHMNMIKLYQQDVDGYIQGMNKMEKVLSHQDNVFLVIQQLYIYLARLLERKLDDPIFNNKKMTRILKRMRYEPIVLLIRYIEAVLRDSSDATKMKAEFLELTNKSHQRGECLDMIDLLSFLEQRFIINSQIKQPLDEVVSAV